MKKLKKIAAVTMAFIICIGFTVYAASYNRAPLAHNSKIVTLKNTKAQGTFSAKDPDGDNFAVKIVTKPKLGYVRVNGLKFIYTPYYNSSGSDSFEFVCTDSKGAESQKAVVYVTIDPETAFRYEDMTLNNSHYSAVKLHHYGIYTGEQIGDEFFFDPDEKLTKGKFLLMILSSLGAKPEACVNTGLTNDRKIPTYYKKYVKEGIKRGIIKEKFFYPNVTLTNAEAVMYISRAADLNVKSASLTMKDRSAIPEWALPFYINLSAYKMLDLYDNCARPNRALKASAASDLVWQLYKLRGK